MLSSSRVYSFSDTYRFPLSSLYTQAVSRVPEYFRGFTCDWWRHNNPSYGDDWRMDGMLTLDLTSSRLKKMFMNLVPALWRIGGTPEDEVRIKSVHVGLIVSQLIRFRTSRCNTLRSNNINISFFLASVLT